jgi:hypothetical protein
MKGPAIHDSGQRIGGRGPLGFLDQQGHAQGTAQLASNDIKNARILKIPEHPSG